jgi:hypothetical protein
VKFNPPLRTRTYGSTNYKTGFILRLSQKKLIVLGVDYKTEFERLKDETILADLKRFIILI